MCLTHLVLRKTHMKGRYWCTVHIKFQQQPNETHPPVTKEAMTYLLARSLTPTDCHSCSWVSTGLASLPWVWQSLVVSPLYQTLKQSGKEVKPYTKHIHQHKKESWQSPPSHASKKKVISDHLLNLPPKQNSGNPNIFPWFKPSWSENLLAPERRQKANGSCSTAQLLTLLHRLWNLGLL